jgi:type VI secretion system protein ImpA
MAVIDIDSILTPIAPDDACGPNLEYDPAFAELDRLAQGKPEQQIGATLVPAEEPDWKAVQRAALALLARSKDLRAASHLTKALLRTAGWPGFAAGLATLRGLVERYWEGLHPRLDPDDGNDPTMRVNALAGLSDAALLSAVRTATLVSSRTMGRFSLRDVEIAAGEVPAPADVSPPGMATVDAAITDCDLATLEEATAAARACVEALSGLEAALGDKLSAAATPNLGRLTGLVRKAAAFLGTGLARRVPSAAGGAEGVGGPADSFGNPAGVSAGGGISSRDDVLRSLDRICAYYARYEPSSPIPMFMERSKRLVTMTFVDIVKELVPEALTQVEVLRGRDN